MLTCRDGSDLERARVLSLHGMSSDAWRRYSGEGFRLYDIAAAGFKYNMSDLQAALGLVQLGKLDANHQRRQARLAQYGDLIAAAFPGGEVTLQQCPPNRKHACHLCIVRLAPGLAPRRDAVITALLKSNVQAYVHYICLTGTQLYRERFHTRLTDTPVAAVLSRRSITLPLFPAMTEADVDYVVAMLSRAVAG
jgi:dTDP-4-amino-4,6-dideoxygalactose transaminase